MNPTPPQHNDPNAGGNGKCCEKCDYWNTDPPRSSGYVWNGVGLSVHDCPCHRITSTLEQIQKERREAWTKAFLIAGTNLVQIDCSSLVSIVNLIRDDAKSEGYRAGLERARALVPNNYVALSLLADIDEEIAKNTPSQLSERDADWCGLPDENARATSDDV